MPSIASQSRDPGSPRASRRLPPLRLLPVALVLLLSCVRGANRPDAPEDVLHYPAWIAPFGNDRLLVVNLDQDLAYDNGALVALDATATPSNAGILGGVPVPNMAGKVLVLDKAAAGKCSSTDDQHPNGAFDAAFPVPFALVGGRFADSVVSVALTEEAGTPFVSRHEFGLHTFSASAPFGVGYTCSPDGTPRGHPRAWVGYETGRNGMGYLTQVDLTGSPDDRANLVEVQVGKGPPRSFAYDERRDRLYFTTREISLAAPIRWIDVGNGCMKTATGVQDPRVGGCHVDPGWDLSVLMRGAEPNEMALSTFEQPCTTGPFIGTMCRRAYLSVRLYDADLATYLGGRPSGDVGGRLVVLELPEGGMGRPEPQVVGSFDIGLTAGGLQVIRRKDEGQPDLVAVTAIDDNLVWIYDDAVGAMVSVIGRAANGVPPLGHQLTALARGPGAPDGWARLFVTSYHDDWVSAVDVPLAMPAVPTDGTTPPEPTIVRDPVDPTKPWHLGVTP